MKYIVKLWMDFLTQSEKDFESMKRGTYAGFIPLAIMAAASIAKAVASHKAGQSAGKEKLRADEEQAKANFESALANENNLEDKRINQVQGIGNQLTGARAVDPKLLASFLKRRAQVARKGTVMDTTKGAGWQLAGNLAGQAGNMASAYMSGLNGGTGPSGADATSLAPSGSGMSPISLGGKTFDFNKKPGETF